MEIDSLVPRMGDVLQQVDGLSVSGSFLYQLRECVQAYFGQDYPTCHELSEQLLDYVWEKLNTGHWKDVLIDWRYAYSHLSMFKALCEWKRAVEQTSYNSNGGSVAMAIKSCDMGLLMGAPIHGNVLSKMASQLVLYDNRKNSKHGTALEPEKARVIPLKKLKLSMESDELSLVKHPIAREACPAVMAFQEFMTSERPLILTKCMDHWPAMTERRWGVGYLRSLCGQRTVPVEIGSKYTEDTWTQSLVTVNEFIEEYIENTKPDKKIGYLAQHQLFQQIPELERDIVVPTYCCLGENDDVDINAWFGPRGTVSPLHHDPKNNLLTQVVGQKYIRIYHRDQTDRVYPRDGLMSNTSLVDVESPDLECFPLFKEAEFADCVLKDGEMLYIPPKHWHYVRSLSVSFSVSFWWE